MVLSYDPAILLLGIYPEENMIWKHAAKSLQSCPTLCDPIDGSPPGSPVLGILQAITLEWVAIFFSNAWKWKVKVKSLSCVWLFATPWTAAYQAPLPMGLSGQEYWSGLPLPSPQEASPALQFQSTSSSVFRHFYGPTFTSVHDYSKTIALAYMVLCQPSDVSAF